MQFPILLLLFVVLGGFSICTAQTAKCAQNGEYCLTHQDCCSRSCLSFSYKCVPVPAGPSIGTTMVPVKPTPIDTENRFGGDDGGASLTQKTCALNGEYCLTHMECCSGSCLTFSYKCVSLNPPATSITVSQDSTPQIATVSFTQRIGDESSISTTTSPPTTQKKCASIGEYCLTSSDCCSKSCLSFAYKCVNRYDLSSDSASAPQTPTVSTSNRFGESASTANTGTSSRKCTNNGLYCFHNHECCSGACFKSICSTEIRIGVPESELTRPSAVNGPYIPVNDLDDLISRFGVQTTTAKNVNGERNARQL
ncbi:uncharacterized protein LOC128731861 isoform X2 [Anopheles nili]|uniref:uncharacterized protein LOC128731861 isoform X2 n=1 Tax=Anopheles nili TaxID=185578 RepID=UPI00237B09B6|nr:uncharacterized protein LOC128731861 isoform X2 [Anopheles nili]